ncbi:MAG: DUF4112 domain-containing protein [Candidatus Levybacteria bacterium]|nr:DUF4112 domain-containing protein [Candidatus Levybacteria bacterium]
MESDFNRAKLIATLLDSQFNVAGIRFGLDPIINIIPWVGDVIGALLSLYILNIAREARVSTIDMIRMVGNIVIDFIVGFVPFLGVIFDVVYKANLRNLTILEKYIGRMQPEGKIIEGSIVS